MKNYLISEAIGDIAGSAYEGRTHRIKDYDKVKMFSSRAHFTDDTVLTFACAEAFIDHLDMAMNLWKCANEHRHAGFGSKFKLWMACHNPQPYRSLGNGSAMRCSSAGWLAKTEEECIRMSHETAAPTHNHPEGVKGAQAIAMCIFLARTGSTKDEIKAYIEKKFGYDLNRTTDMIRPDYIFHVDCQQSVPESIICFLEAKSTLEAIQLAISLGGDTDTMADMAGAIAEAYYGDCDDLFEDTIEKSFQYPKAFVEVIKEFNEKISE